MAQRQGGHGKPSGRENGGPAGRSDYTTPTAHHKQGTGRRAQRMCLLHVGQSTRRRGGAKRLRGCDCQIMPNRGGGLCHRGRPIPRLATGMPLYGTARATRRHMGNGEPAVFLHHRGPIPPRPNHRRHHKTGHCTTTSAVAREVRRARNRSSDVHGGATGGGDYGRRTETRHDGTDGDRSRDATALQRPTPTSRRMPTVQGAGAARR